MLATFSGTQAAMVAAPCRSQRMPFSMPAMCMFAAAASIITIGTGVITSVSLFQLLVASLILADLVVVVIISLLLTCLIRHVGLERLVRLITMVAIRTAQGD